jgi:hypothetical protein
MIGDRWSYENWMNDRAAEESGITTQLLKNLAEQQKKIMSKNINAKPLTELELYELIVAAYPDEFDESTGDIWDLVMEFIEEELGDIDVICNLLGRVAMLTSPLGSAISGELYHCLGPVTIKNGTASMTAAVKRPAVVESDEL